MLNFFRNTFWVSTCLGLTLLLPSLSASANPVSIEKTLNNGLKVIIREDKRAPVALVQVWYKVGSTDESGHQLGVSHVLEHMMFKGTDKVPNNEFTRLSRVYGGTINAATFTNYTNYYQLYPKAYLALALELEADRMINLKLREDDFSTEIKVVREERRQRTDDNPRALAFERFKWLAYPTSPYRNPVIGHMRNLQALTLADVKDWYQKWYTPNNAVLVIVGDVDSKIAMRQVEQYFGKVPARSLAKRPPVTELFQVGYRHMQVKMPVQIPNLLMAWNVRSLGTDPTMKDALALSLIQSILDLGLSARFKTELIRDQKNFSSTSVSYDLYNRGDTIFYISALPERHISMPDAEKIIKQQIQKFKTELVSQEELSRVMNMMISQHLFSQDTVLGQAKLIGNLEVNGLNHRLIDQLPQLYEQITPQDIQRVARLYFTDDNLTSLYLTPIDSK